MFHRLTGFGDGVSRGFGKALRRLTNDFYAFPNQTLSPPGTRIAFANTTYLTPLFVLPQFPHFIVAVVTGICGISMCVINPT